MQPTQNQANRAADADYCHSEVVETHARGDWDHIFARAFDSKLDNLRCGTGMRPGRISWTDDFWAAQLEASEFTSSNRLGVVSAWSGCYPNPNLLAFGSECECPSSVDGFNLCEWDNAGTKRVDHSKALVVNQQLWPYQDRPDEASSRGSKEQCRPLDFFRIEDNLHAKEKQHDCSDSSQENCALWSEYSQICHVDSLSGLSRSTDEERK